LVFLLSVWQVEALSIASKRPLVTKSVVFQAAIFRDGVPYWHES
jgi:hypothetical protein